jgi:outer membrane immunogenic protein
MRRLSLSITVVLALIAPPHLFAGPESLQPKESKAIVQPAPPPECTWSGFYLGVHGGYIWSDNWSFRELNETDPPFEFERNGFVGGGQAGYNLQLGPWFVIGLEGTFSAGDLGDKTRINKGGSDLVEGHLHGNWIATVGGRVGVSFCHNRLLAYAKGGVAFSDYDFNTREIGDNGKFHADDNETLPLIGIGLEYAFNCHWSIRAEYNHLFADGDNNVTGVELDGGNRENRTFHVNQGDRDLISAGLNFRF